MIILGDSRDGINFLHIVIGPETEFQFNLSGQSTMDITEYINNNRGGEKYIIVMNRCDSEEDLIQQLNMNKAKSKARNILEQAATQMNNDQEEKSNDQSTKQKDKKKGSGIKCPECNAADSAIIIDGSVQPCISCQKINEGLKSGSIPPIPTKTQLKKIKKDTETKNPTQKKSIFRFFKDQDNSSSTETEIPVR